MSTKNYNDKVHNCYYTVLEKYKKTNFELKLNKLTKTSKLAQQTFTCSKSTTETLEKGVKYVQS